MQQCGWKTQNIFGHRKQKKGQGRSHLWKAEGGSHMMEKHGDRSTQAQLGFWWGLFPVRPGKCGPQLSRVIKATTCSSLKASLCFLAPSSCSSAHTIWPSEVNAYNTRRAQSVLWNQKLVVWGRQQLFYSFCMLKASVCHCWDQRLYFCNIYRTPL